MAFCILMWSHQQNEHSLQTTFQHWRSRTGILHAIKDMLLVVVEHYQRVKMRARVGPIRKVALNLWAVGRTVDHRGTNVASRQNKLSSIWQ